MITYILQYEIPFKVKFLNLGHDLLLEGPKSNQSIIETILLCLVISMYVVSVNYCVQSSKAYEASVIV